MSNSALRRRAAARSHALARHREADQLGDAGRGGAGAEKQEALLGELLPGEAQRGEDAGQRDAGGALDVVIEGADLVAIARQDRNGVDVGEILPLDAAFRVELPAPPRRTPRQRRSSLRRARAAGAARDRAGHRAELWLFVPTSRTIGRQYCGGTPAQAV